MLLGQISAAFGRLERFGQQFLHPLGADAFAPLDQGGRVEGEAMLEVLKAAKVLPVGVLDKPHDHDFITDVEGMLEVMQPHQQADRSGRATDFFDVQPAKLLFKHRPIDSIRKLKQRMLAVENLVEAGAVEIPLVNRLRFWLHKSPVFEG